MIWPGISVLQGFQDPGIAQQQQIRSTVNGFLFWPCVRLGGLFNGYRVTGMVEYTALRRAFCSVGRSVQVSNRFGIAIWYLLWSTLDSSQQSHYQISAFIYLCLHMLSSSLILLSQHIHNMDLLHILGWLLQLFWCWCLSMLQSLTQGPSKIVSLLVALFKC